MGWVSGLPYPNVDFRGARGRDWLIIFCNGVETLMQKTKSETELRLALRRLRHIFAIIFVFSFFINLLMLTAPLYMLQIYDRVLASSSVDTLIALSVLAVGLFLLQALLDIVRNQILVRVGSRLDASVGRALLGAIVKDNLANKGVPAGVTFADLDLLKSFITGRGLISFFDAPWVPFFIGVIYLMHPLLGIVAAIGAIVLAALTVIGELVTREDNGEAAKYRRAAANFADSSLRNAEAIEAMGMMPRIQERWFRHFNRGMYSQSRAGDRSATINGVAQFWRTALQSSMLGFGAWLAIHQEITPGVMVAASIMLGRALAPLLQIIGVWRQVTTARQVYARLNRLLESAEPEKEAVSLPAPKGVLTVEKVFAAPPGHQKPFLQGISFGAQPGSVLGVIGPSASGKSSLARLLVGAWKPVNGHVRLDGAEVSDWVSSERGRYVGYLPQDVELFDGTIADNIGRFEEIDSQKIVAAAQAAGAHEMILRLPNGYETPIGSNAHILSAGQRQRIGLARALYGNPPFVVLDEPNANLDHEGELALRGAILRLKEEKKTVILIAHHSGLIRWCDNVLVLNSGRIEMYGPHEDVVAKLARPGGADASEAASDGAAAKGSSSASAVQVATPLRRPVTEAKAVKGTASASKKKDGSKKVRDFDEAASK